MAPCPDSFDKMANDKSNDIDKPGVISKSDNLGRGKLGLEIHCPTEEEGSGWGFVVIMGELGWGKRGSESMEARGLRRQKESILLTIAPADALTHFFAFSSEPAKAGCAAASMMGKSVQALALWQSGRRSGLRKESKSGVGVGVMVAAHVLRNGAAALVSSVKSREMPSTNLF